MSGFINAAKAVLKERATRPKVSEMLSTGVKFVDDAGHGLLPGELALLGAYSGQGKTQLCVNAALANLEDNKRVHFIALEAAEYEIEQRLKYQVIANYFFSDPDRPNLSGGLSFPGWLLGKYGDKLDEYETLANKYCVSAFKNLFTYYKGDNFGVLDLIQNFLQIEDETDLVIVDHVQYFDYDSDNDNRAIKEIAKTVRTLALESGIPVLLVSHLRKKDRQSKELVPGLDEFHGSSDLTKIATKVITVTQGPALSDGRFVTYFRIAKNRIDGGATRFVGACVFDPKKGRYIDDYGVGRVNSESFKQIEIEKYPRWAKYFDCSRHWNFDVPGEAGPIKVKRPSTTPQGIYNPSQRN